MKVATKIFSEVLHILTGNDVISNLQSAANRVISSILNLQFLCNHSTYFDKVDSFGNDNSSSSFPLVQIIRSQKWGPNWAHRRRAGMIRGLRNGRLHSTFCQ